MVEILDEACCVVPNGGLHFVEESVDALGRGA